MKNYNHQKELLNQDKSLIKEIDRDKIKTTNVNILLNRVRLDQKRILKKRIFFSASIIMVVSLLIAISIL